MLHGALQLSFLFIANLNFSQFIIATWQFHILDQSGSSLLQLNG